MGFVWSERVNRRNHLAKNVFLSLRIVVWENYEKYFLKLVLPLFKVRDLGLRAQCLHSLLHAQQDALTQYKEILVLNIVLLQDMWQWNIMFKYEMWQQRCLQDKIYNMNPLN
jgi:hypothetical protein